MYHIPALLNESIDALNIKPEGIYVDATLGGGGHAEEILKKMTTGFLIAFDVDSDAVENARKLEVKFGKKIIFVHHNFCYLSNFLRYHNIEKVDGILADLGVSSHQFDNPERGFSFRFDTELDMRMNKNAIKSAKDILNKYTFDELKTIFKTYGDIKRTDKLASAICKNRESKPYNTIGDLLHTSETFLKSIMPKHKISGKENKWYAKIFQALRIEVNNEMENLKNFLKQTAIALKPGGRLAVITYHSVEDRMVKNFIKTGNFDGVENKDIYGNLLTPFEIINRKVIQAEEKEIEQNNRARSAKLRIAKRKKNGTKNI